MLAAHGEADDCVQVSDGESLAKDILGFDYVAVVEGFGERGRIGRGGRLAVAEHSDDKYRVGGEGAGKGECCAEAAAITGWDQGELLGRGCCRGGNEGVGNIDGESGARDEGEGGDVVIFNFELVGHDES